MKEYSYMDQMPEQEVDIHDGIENTLVMLRHRLKNGIEVTREYDRSIPRISARGSELNKFGRTSFPMLLMRWAKKAISNSHGEGAGQGIGADYR